MMAAGDGTQIELLRQFRVAGLNEKRTIFEDNGRYDTHAVIHCHDLLFRFLVLFDIDPDIRYLVFAQELFAAAAVRAPVCAVDGYSWFTHC